MAIYLPENARTAAESLTPREIVAELDKYVVGQHKAKRAVAIALRNRMRRQQLPPEMADEVAPKNILMIGPTGVGKTEIARRLARLAQSPFIKVEASKFTEVGYVGRDVESMVRDLVELAVDMVREERPDEVRDKARQHAEERLLDLLLPPLARAVADPARHAAPSASRRKRTRERLREQLRDGRLDRARRSRSTCARTVDPVIRDHRRHVVEEIGINLKDMMPGLFQGRTQKRRSCKVPEALENLIAGRGAEAGRHGVGRAATPSSASSRPASSSSTRSTRSRAAKAATRGPDVSREGVQRDILPIVEGTTVNTKYGMVKTDHILFIAAGAFHVSKPSDLIPELQGRFPIRVELEPLTRDGLRAHPHRAAKTRSIKQYTALLGTEGRDAARSPTMHRPHRATSPTRVNERTENIGARRLHTVMERLLDEISFDAPDLARQVGHDRRGLRRPHARRHRQERRPVAIHPVIRPCRSV